MLERQVNAYDTETRKVALCKLSCHCFTCLCVWVVDKSAIEGHLWESVLNCDRMQKSRKNRGEFGILGFRRGARADMETDLLRRLQTRKLSRLGRNPKTDCVTTDEVALFGWGQNGGIRHRSITSTTQSQWIKNKPQTWGWKQKTFATTKENTLTDVYYVHSFTRCGIPLAVADDLARMTINPCYMS